MGIRMILGGGALSICLLTGSLAPSPAVAATSDEAIILELTRQADVARAERNHLHDEEYWKTQYWETAGKRLAVNSKFTYIKWPEISFIFQMIVAGSISQPLGDVSNRYRIAFINPVYDLVMFIEYERQPDGKDKPSNAWIIPGEVIRGEPIDDIMVKWLRKGSKFHGEYIDGFITIFRKLASKEFTSSSVEDLQKTYSEKYAGKNDPRKLFEQRVLVLAAAASKGEFPCIELAHSIAKDPSQYIGRAVQSNIDLKTGLIKNQAPGLVFGVPYFDGVLAVYTLTYYPEYHYIITAFPENGQCRPGHILGVYWGHAMYDATRP